MSLIEKETNMLRAKRRPTPEKPVIRAIAPAGKSGRIAAPAAPFRMPKLKAVSFPNRIFDIRKYGALGDGQFDCCSALAKAIDACHSAGGGKVLVPPGKWFTGPIHLKSNVNLHLEDGAIVRFSSDPARYLPPVFVRWGGVECYNYSPLIYARDCTNIAITGKGVLLGQGKPWWGWEKLQDKSRQRAYDMALTNVPIEKRLFGCEEFPLRPQLILPIDCTDVLLQDFTIAEGGPSWNVHIAYCANVTIRNIKINAPDGPNNDGIDIDSSCNVLIEDCELHTGDDCIALKSGMNEDGWRVGRPTENVIIRRIRATAGQGGVTIGSDMSGGVRNVFVHDCTFDNVSAGIRMKASRGRGGVVENIVVQDIRMGTIPGDAIQLTTDYPSFVKSDGKPPSFRDIHIRNVTCEKAKAAVRIVGQSDSPFRDINLENLSIVAEEGLQCVSGNGINLVDVRITPKLGPVLSLRDTQKVLIHGLNSVNPNSVFLDLRGRQTRNIRLGGESSTKTRPAIVLGIDVPRDAIVHE
jgi:polygalacturonase